MKLAWTGSWALLIVAGTIPGNAVASATTAEPIRGEESAFDWRIPEGTTLVFDTVSQVITGGPGFAPATRRLCTGGRVEVRNLEVASGATLRFVGPNPVRILASGTVRVLGTISIDGDDSPGVLVLNTAQIPEPGAAGNAGGGAGGTGSPKTDVSSSRGGAGQGAFGLPEEGGQGGETGWNTIANPDARRGAGGGGGRFGPDQGVSGSAASSFIGLDAEAGFAGGAMAFGALDPALLESPPGGGLPGVGPFVDGDPANDFFGVRVDPATGAATIGELPHPWAGAGGGGGGDASLVTDPSGVFPNAAFTPQGDEKGAGGGGGAGSLVVLAEGEIVFGPAGRVSARGGHGGGGENTLFLNRVGGGSGGGSGGHVILQSPRAIDFRSAHGGPAVIATGGQGGAGKGDQGGASLGGPTSPDQDACPDPSLPGCVLGPVEGAGGDGGPGVVQLHTPRILLGHGSTLGQLVVPFPVTGLELLPVPNEAAAAPPPEPARALAEWPRWLRLGR